MPQDWRSWKLKRLTLVITLCLEVALIAGIVTTTILTRTKDGFIAVTNEPIRTVRGISINSRLKWSAVPAFVMALFGLLYAAIVSSAAQRQPFVELVLNGHPPDPRSARDARVTITLDYLSYPIFYSWFIAMKNSHFHLAGALLFQLLASVLLVPLASNLFTPETTQSPSGITLRSTSVFNLSLLDTSRPLLPALDLTSAIWNYGARPPVWMTTDMSLEDFALLQPSTGNLTVETVAYGVKPQCQQIPASEVQVNYVPNSAAGTVVVSFVDRNCEVEPSPWSIVPTTRSRSYSYTWFQSCSASDKSEDRMGIFAAAYNASSSNKLTNTTLVSCLPTYWKFNIELSMAVNNGAVKEILGIKQVREEQLRSDLFRAVHSNLALTRTQESIDNLAADSFGRVVLAYARETNSNVQIDADAITNATEAIYRTFFAALARNELMTDPVEGSELKAIIQQTAIRLFTLLPIACTLGVLIFMMSLSTLGILIHVESTSSCLQEEPKGLLRLAMLLCRSDLMTFVEDFRSNHTTDRSPGRSVEEHWSIREAKCWYDDEAGEGAGRIRLAGLRRLTPGKTRWQKLKARLPVFQNKRTSVDDIDLSEQQPLRSRTKTVVINQQQVK